MTYPDLDRPSALDDPQWEVVRALRERMLGAYANNDPELAVGSAKELVEAVARMVLDARGVPHGNSTDSPKLVNEAHKALGRQPGQGLATDPPVRDIAQAAKNAVVSVGQLRNSHGTGHGRVEPAGTIDEHAAVAVDAALLWSRWALRRLDRIVEGRAVDIIRDLRAPATFFKHDLARRLEAADLSSLDDADLRRLGLAVGQRAATGTFNVLEDGMESPAAASAPAAYRASAIEGAFIDQQGYVRSTVSTARAALQLLRTLDPAAASDALDRTISAARDADASYAFDLADGQAVADELASRLDLFEPEVRERLADLAEVIRR